MIRISQIKLSPGSGLGLAKEKAAKRLRIEEKEIRELTVLKKSLDARKKNQILEIYTVAVSTGLSSKKEEQLVKRLKSADISLYEPVRYDFASYVPAERKDSGRLVICGYGPAGIFAAYLLAEAGFAPLVLERGKEAGARQGAVEEFFSKGRLDPDCNMQFGEGGAGMFSDGKLNTLVKDEKGRGRFVLETLVKFGAPSSILYDAKPHLGTDGLIKIIPGIREETLRLGGEIRFGHRLTDVQIRDGRLQAVVVNGKEEIRTGRLLLCTGHSARDTLGMLHGRGIRMEAKAFAAGVRIEHSRQMIDAELQHESASYKLTHRCTDGRGVYSFCMCPGGVVVNASSEEVHLAVNGMSDFQRDGINSNSAIVVTLNPADYGGDPADPLRGIAFQRLLEKKAYQALSGKIPYQRLEDFIKNIPSAKAGTVSPQCRGSCGFGNVRELLPRFMAEDILEGILAFDRQIKGFAMPDALISGVESRTSCPVRLIRGETLETEGIKGIYPAGEGAGYAGGIMSAAMDGMKCAESCVREYME